MRYANTVLQKKKQKKLNFVQKNLLKINYYLKKNILIYLLIILHLKFAIVFEIILNKELHLSASKRVLGNGNGVCECNAASNALPQ